MSIKKLLVLPIVGIGLFSCAGSPVHTSRMDSVAIQSVDSYTLCKAYTPRELYSPSVTVINEVRRRQINCEAIYSYSGTGDLEAAAAILRRVQSMPTVPSPSSVAFLKSTYVSGFNRVCIYQRRGSDEAYTLEATAICPQTMP
jgi:hypothetical protein